MNALQFPSLTLSTSKAGLSAGTTSTLSTANTAQYMIRGKAYTKAAVTNAATPVVDATTGLAFPAVPVNAGCAILIGLDAAGAFKVSQGPAQALDNAGNFVLAPQFPITPDSVCPVSYLVVKVGATGAAWTFGTSNLAGPPTGTSLSFVDLGTLPDRPQIA